MAPRLSKSLLGTLRTPPLRSIASRQVLFYHSYEHPEPPPFAPTESAILSAALSHVPNYGFTTAALKFGARDAGYLDVSTNLLPRGVFELVNYHLVMQRLALKDSVQFPGETELGSGKRIGVGAKVRTLTMARLRANEPVLHRWQEVRPSF
jgi:ubiquinone biosynthesis protein COQ9